MTAKEMTALEKLREELREYHEEVVRHIAHCESCRSDVAKLNIDVYGLPGNKESSPGLIGEIATLRSGRKTLLWAVRGAWALIVGLVCAAVGVRFAK